MAQTIATDRQSNANPEPGKTQRLLLHCCCAPCASYVLEYLSPQYDITIFYYNPNIQPREEYDKRAAQFDILLKLAKYENKVELLFGEYASSDYEAAAAPFANEPEGGKRCSVCFALRLEEAAKRAKSGGFDCFTSTLSVSPHKNAELLNRIGNELAEEYAVEYLEADFKKRDGYKRSVELSKQYGLYRQMYCGCRWSNNDRSSARIT